MASGKGKGDVSEEKGEWNGEDERKWTGELGCNALGEGMIVILRKEGNNSSLIPMLG